MFDLGGVARHLHVVAGPEPPDVHGGVLASGGDPSAVGGGVDAEERPFPCEELLGSLGFGGPVPVQSAVAGGADREAVGGPGHCGDGGRQRSPCGDGGSGGVGDSEVTSGRYSDECLGGGPGERSALSGEADVDWVGRVGGGVDAQMVVVAGGGEVGAVVGPVAGEDFEVVCVELVGDGAGGAVEERGSSRQRSGEHLDAVGGRGGEGGVVVEAGRPGASSTRSAVRVRVAMGSVGEAGGE